MASEISRPKRQNTLVILCTPWFEDLSTEVSVDLAGSKRQTQQNARNAFERQQSWTSWISRALVSFMTLRGVQILEKDDQIDVEAQGTFDLPVVILIYRYDRRVACFWLIIALGVSMAFGIAAGVISQTVQVGIDLGTGVLAFLTVIHKILNCAVDSKDYPGR